MNEYSLLSPNSSLIFCFHSTSGDKTADDNELDSESQSDQCGYNERDYVEETRDSRSVSSHERFDMNCH